VIQIAKQIVGTKTLKSSNFLQNRIWHCDSEFLGWFILSHQFLLHDDDDDDNRGFSYGAFLGPFFSSISTQNGQVFFLGLSHYKSISTGTQYVALHWKPCRRCGSHMISIAQNLQCACPFVQNHYWRSVSAHVCSAEWLISFGDSILNISEYTKRFCSFCNHRILFCSFLRGIKFEKFSISGK
jgi:hypothetical protein